MPTRFRLGSTMALTVLLLSAGAASAQFNLRATPPPTPGQCQSVPVIATGHNAAQAQQVWAAMATQLHGPNWAYWLAAANKTVFPNGNSGWMASARPCFFIPAG